MPFQFPQLEEAAAAPLIDAALAEDVGEMGDLTCRALIDECETGRVEVVARRPGVVVGGPVAQMVFERLDPAVNYDTRIGDGAAVESGSVIAVAAGPLRSLLTGERTALNFLTHLSGIASLTRQYVDAVSGTRVKILDTRKTLPAYRLLQKYAVRAGGGANHRLGLYDGILIKDNHLAAWCRADSGGSIAAAIRHARQSAPDGISIEVEVDRLDQLADALVGRPDVVLLDNMSCDRLREAVALRDSSAAGVLLEASGGVSLETVAGIAQTGVERISIGALTHSAPALDIAFDWAECRVEELT